MGKMKIGFGRKKGHFRDIGNDVWERVEGGIVKGVAILNFKKRTRQKTAVIDLPLDIQLESSKA